MKNISVVRTFAALLLLLSGGVGLAQRPAAAPDLMSLVEAERAFARTSVEKGLRASFLEYFADGCISFAPEPGDARKRLLSRPAPATPPTLVLNWFPIYADIARSGELGYTTGPATYLDHGPKPRAPYYGYYFSIWKKQADGAWKVALDIGTETPDASAMPRQEFTPAPAGPTRSTKELDPAKGRAEIDQLEIGFAKLTSAKGIKAAYLKYRAADLRLHRDGHFPLTGAAVEHNFLWDQALFANSTAAFSEVARSGDLGYAYGSYELKNKAGAIVEKGFFTRVWRKNAAGAWKLAADITNIQPANK